MTSFDKSNMKHVETQEKNTLPGADSIKAEAEHNEFKSGIENFKKESLKTADTVEKNTLPTKEVRKELKIFAVYHVMVIYFHFR